MVRVADRVSIHDDIHAPTTTIHLPLDHFLPFEIHETGE